MSAPKTTRDQLGLLVDVFRRAMRHIWLVSIIVIVGAGLSVALALSQKPNYDSEAVLLYQEKLSTSVLQGRNVARSNRGISARFREMLLSRTTLSAVVEEFDLYPEVVATEGTVAAAEKLRLLVGFSGRGASTYRISFRGNSPEQAQTITARLAAMLQDKEKTIRKNLAEQTKLFLEGEKTSAENRLIAAEQEFVFFVTEHPEFVTETTAAGGSSVGASIRAAVAKTGTTTSKRGGSRLGALQRAAKRLRDRIANPDAPIVVATPRSRRAVSPVLRAARNDLDSAKRSYDDKSGRFTPKHPDVIAAKNNVAESTRRLRRLEAAEQAISPAEGPTSIAPSASVADLRKELSRIENEVARLKASKGDTTAAKPDSNKLADALVTLEIEHARLQRRVSVAQQRFSSLEARVFTAEITASSEYAQAAKLVIIDEAFLPALPAGKGRKVVVIAGTFAFGFIGCVLALGLALIDDRIYRRADIDDLGIAPVLIVIPKEAKNKRKRFRRG